MKKMNMLMMVLGLIIAQSSYAQDPTPTPISKAEATELSVHRVERLVITKKIEKDFQLKLSSMVIETLPTPTADTDPAFKITGTQFAAPGAKVETLVIFMNLQGKVLNYTFDQDGADSNVAIFPDKDAATLLEFSLHEIEKEGPTRADALPFYADLKSVTLVPQFNTQGQISGVIAELLSNTVTTKLSYTMSLDGTITGRTLQ